MACVLQIGAGGVGGVVAHKMAINRAESGGVFSRIILASRTLSKCKAIADSIHSKGFGEIEIDEVDADNVESVVALIEKYRPKLVVNVALPYQDLAIMEACLRTKTHYLDTANYEHPDNAYFEYKEQWAYDTRYKEAGIFALLGSGFDPGVTNVFCAYAQKHYFDEIHSIDILDCNAGDHGYAFATNFNPEINLREVSSKARYWVKENSTLGEICGSLHSSHCGAHASAPHSPNATQPTNFSQDSRISSDFAQKLCNSSVANSVSLDSNLALNPDLQEDKIYRKFEREEKHFALESNTQDLQNVPYFNGQWRDVAPLALMKEWDYLGVGVKNSYLLYHEELESLIRNIKGLRKIRFFMTFGESYLTHMKCLENVGLLRIDEVAHKGGKIVPIEVLKTLLPDPASLAPRTKGQTHIGCYIKGLKDGKERVIYIYNICTHEECYAEVGAQGVSYTTGVPAMIGAKLICEGKWGINCEKITNSVCSDFLGSASDASLQRTRSASHSLTSHNPKNSSATLEFENLDSNGLGCVPSFNADMPKGGESQGLDSNQGSGVWNMEQNNPDPFMEELNKQGLPYVVVEFDENGSHKVLEDGRKK
ncbi:saccharopine dehydrogenase family protein [Helicobacter sp. MIT 01-3238]|uniref:saccharopine dehydrogenase family protein n=1 Tax=Helicobacter sp. MIT 01-3238 TaxID=398627 RepID=UPI000E399F16|nr:saccharopine dehydrogenase family protein [Helicobacter sp. MIT 01-3238]RDU54765.1 saccharopine dehydrogenase [Helicobacter sp. MIT 01-3238]